MNLYRQPTAYLSIAIYVAIVAVVLLLTDQKSSALAADYPIVDTGQITCYDDSGVATACPAEGEAFYGQDAQFTGSTFNFTDTGDGTVTDSVTGLIWQQTPDNNKVSWDDAQSYCEALTLAGSENWRTPSLKELFSISDFESGWPYIDMDYFDLVTESGQDKQEQYWSSNHYEVGTTHGGQSSAFGVNHATGDIKTYPDGSDGSPMAGKYVRCVQGDNYLVSDFVDNGDGTITDSATGLMWMQDDSGEGIDWESALAYADGFSFAGYDDWRLPDVKELQSIVDYSGIYPAIDSSYFNYTDEDAYFWSSTSAYFSPQTPGYYYAWYVAFGYAVDAEGNDTHGAGAVRFDTKVEGGPAGEDPERVYNYVRLVRGGEKTGTPDGDPTADDSVTFVEPTDGSPGEQGGPEGMSGSNQEPTGEQPDLAAAAEELGVTEDALQAALGDPSQGPPDFAIAAEALGVTEEALIEALDLSASAPQMGGQSSNQQPNVQQPAPQVANNEALSANAQTVPAGPIDGVAGQPSVSGQMFDLAAAAAKLGVTEDALQTALDNHSQGRPDFAAVAAELGGTEEALLAALGLAAVAPPTGGPANGQPQAGGQPPMGRP